MCVCMYTNARTHTAEMGYLDVSPEVGMRHLEGPKNADGLNFGMHIFVYVYKGHMCTYMRRGGMRSWTNCFFLYAYVYGCVYVCMCMYMCIYIYMYVYVCVYIYVYVSISHVCAVCFVYH